MSAFLLYHVKQYDRNPIYFRSTSTSLTEIQSNRQNILDY